MYFNMYLYSKQCLYSYYSHASLGVGIFLFHEVIIFIKVCSIHVIYYSNIHLITFIYQTHWPLVCCTTGSNIVIVIGLFRIVTKILHYYFILTLQTRTWYSCSTMVPVYWKYKILLTLICLLKYFNSIWTCTAGYLSSSSSINCSISCVQ